MCNLNFNQCNLGCYYPRPIDTCRSRLISLLNTGTTTVINPQIMPTWAFSNFTVPQEVWSGSIFGVRKQASAGSGITDNVDGSFALSAGTYQIEYNVNGVVPNTQLEVAAVVDGVIIQDSRSISNGTPDAVVDLSGRSVFSVGDAGALFALLNIGSENATFNRASLTINKLR